MEEEEVKERREVDSVEEMFVNAEVVTEREGRSSMVDKRGI